jgi:hypothetical protein
MKRKYAMTENTLQTNRRHALAVMGMAAALALTACGGGGGGTAPADPGNPGIPGIPDIPDGPATGLVDWQPAALLAAVGGDDSDVQSMKLAVNASEQAAAAWIQRDGGRTSLMVSRRDADGVWAEAERVDSIVTGGATGQQVSIDAAGNVFVVWTEAHEPGLSRVVANRYDAQAEAWSGERVLLGSSPGYKGSAPSLAVAANGNAVVVWQEEFDGIVPVVRIMNNVYQIGGDWGDAAKPVLRTNESVTQLRPQVALDLQGNATAIWEIPSVNDAANRIGSAQLKVGESANGWGGHADLVFDFASAVVGSMKMPSMAVAPDGQAMVAWQLAQASGDKGIFVSTRNLAEPVWSIGVAVAPLGALSPSNPRIAIDAQGNAQVVWQQNTPALIATTIASRRFEKASGQWSAGVVLLENERGGLHSVPQLAVDTDGNALAVWTQGDGVRINVLGARYTVGSGWTTTGTTLEPDRLGTAGTPDVVMTPGGKGLAIWSRVVATQTGGGDTARNDALVSSVWTAEFK